MNQATRSPSTQASSALRRESVANRLAAAVTACVCACVCVFARAYVCLCVCEGKKENILLPYSRTSIKRTI